MSVLPDYSGGNQIGQITPLGPYPFPPQSGQTPPWQKCWTCPQTSPVQTFVQVGTHYCPECHKAARIESVIVKKRELKDGSEVAERTARALLCAEHGVLAWLDLPPK